VGGLVGSQTSTGIGYGIDTSYSTGLVTGTTNVGGFVGNQTNTSVFDTCFWNNTINPSLQSIGNLGSYPSIYPSSTTQMQTQSTYLAWDFTNTWEISPNNYPSFIPLNTIGNCHFPTTLEAAFNYSPIPSCVTDSVFFTDESTDSPTAWNWNFGDISSPNNTSILQNPAHLFSGTGTFYVTLIATAGLQTDSIVTPIIVTNCVTTIQQISRANCNVTVYPNPGNGIFTFIIQNASANSILEVYNVLGEKVYSIRMDPFGKSHQPSANGYQPIIIDISNQPKGVYFYKLISNSMVEKNGKLVVE
jgi:PKD repeat protein